MATDRHGFLTWSTGFSQSDIILNNLLDKLDSKLGTSVISRTTTAQPGAPSAGDMYIIPAGATGAAWSGFSANYVAIFRSGAWVAFTPISGWPAWVEDDAEGVMFNGTSWVVVSKDLPKDKFDATADPTVNNDSTENYSVGSRWVNVMDDKAFVCLDATAAAAVWTEITAGGEAAASQAEMEAGIEAGIRRVSPLRVAQAIAALGATTKYIGQNLQTGTVYTLVLADAGEVIEMNNAAANTLTIPANASVAFPVDTRIDVVQGGAGQTTIAITSDTLRGDPKIAAQYNMVSLWKRAATEWVVIGGTT